MFELENATFACGVRSARGRSFEEASGETEVGRRLLAPEPRPLPPLAPRTRPGTQTDLTEPQVEPATPRRYIPRNWTIPVVMLVDTCCGLWETTATLSANSCKSASFLTHFTSVLQTVRRERHVS